MPCVKVNTVSGYMYLVFVYRVLANYIVWRSVEPLTGYLTHEFLNAALQLDKAESGIKQYPERWKRCLGKVGSALGFALGALYIKDHFAESSKTEVCFCLCVI